MGKWHFVTLFSVILALGLLFFLNNYKGYDELISPMLKQEKVLGINQWFPKDILDSQETAPKITAKSAIFLDSKDGTILYSKNINEKLPIASLAKVMTVLISLEHKKMEDDFTISKRATEMEPDEMILLPEETLTLKELLYGIFLVSANDAAEVLAESVTGNRDEFIKLMNKKAKQLGMENSYFANPTGLDEDDNNSFSSAYDLAILARFLIHHYPEVVEISKTPYIFIPETESHQSYEMWSGINLLTTYPGVVGFKTGYTPDAGLTLITLARIDGHEVIGVLLGSEARRDEARELLDYSFKKLIQ
ncbi:hypothetical protein A3J13_01130 [Candidatus Daviesbacteria bacterium RIFCSPLOWO2_02_FULL_36_8]|uniref:Peptidase S11 D-alanyl-D-alanine carboxypeptidase A N-terminal domain-containing protein n=1 Tax=Candidatus Daviesbacteria bacterium RIFCSPLOWO2_02_FULL_36_8 TaxID=1797793 RepID=A0A1F5MFE1_9BACT|nr:MAG: hypothetical protein A3J13_01130 [Candidatus Daviesbacteria bacterium RIFCSPLOWO2_02_FULL_36_8]